MGQSEDLVPQELWACFSRIAVTRLIANHGEAEMPSAVCGGQAGSAGQFQPQPADG